jgi:signal transduction histidine kinase
MSAPVAVPPRTRGRLHAVATDAGRDLGYLAIALVTSAIALGAWIAGVTVVLSLAPFVLGLPAFLVAAVAFRGVAELDRRNAARVLGAPVRGAYRDHGADGLLGRVRATAGDPQTWRDLAWLVVHSVVGLAFGCIALGAAADTIALAVSPAWYWALPDGIDLGIWRIDTLGEAFAAVAPALPCAAVTVSLARVMARTHARLAARLLGGVPGATAAGRRSAPARPLEATLRPALRPHAGLAGLAGTLCTVVWALTGTGYFWPVWVWLGAAVTLGLHVAAIRAARAAGDPPAAFRVKVEFCTGVALLCVAVWALAGGGYPWPVWPAIGMAAALAVRALLVFRNRELVERVDELARTRRGALDVQAAELRRIERDLHDGAQARLVSLSMLMGRAEEHLADRPEVAELVRRAREEAGEAIRELRDLARGIAPPVLTDRGLAAAIEALAVRAPMKVTVDVDDGGRPAPVVEAAAYFVVAEALTNAAKHGAGAPAHVAVARRGDVLAIEVTDEGPGGADAAGSGLTGLRHRVEALDGTLRVEGALPTGTRIRAELPCGS